MKIQYEEGDRVFKCPYYGGESYEVLHVRKNGVTVKDEFGQSFFLGNRQAEPAPGTLRDAKVVNVVREAELLQTLRDLYDSYRALADSGDCGYWKVEDLPEGKAALEIMGDKP